jgi:hypothetical protein
MSLARQTPDPAGLDARVTAIEARLARLERQGPRDGTEAGVVVTLAERIGARHYTAAELIRHATVDPELAAALEAADVTNPRELGQLLRRVEHRTIEGLTVERVGQGRDGLVWRVVRV